MDQLTPRPEFPRCVADRIRLSALEAGIGRGEPLEPLVSALADLPDEIDRRLDKIKAEMAGLVARVEEVANRPAASPEMKDEHVQRVVYSMGMGVDRYVRNLVRTNIYRAVAIGAASVVGGLALAFLIGLRVQELRTPELVCGRQMLPTGEPICYRVVGPPSGEASPGRPPPR